jgi:hypothetical protein
MISFSKYYEDKYRVVNSAYSSNKDSNGSNNIKTFPDDVNRALLCNFGTLETVERLISNGANLHEVNSLGLTALHIAALKSEEKGGPVIELLLKNGADILAKANFSGIIKRPVDLISLSWLKSQIINIKNSTLSSQEDVNLFSQFAKAVNYLDKSKLNITNKEKLKEISLIATTFEECLKHIIKLHDQYGLQLTEWRESICKVNIEEYDFINKCLINQPIIEDVNHSLMGEFSSKNSE